MSLLDNKVMEKIIKALKDKGIDPDDGIMIDKFQLTEIPDDLHLTRIALSRVEQEAEGIPEKYLCYMCGEPHETSQGFIKCMQSHIDDFMAGVPINMNDDLKKKRMKILREPLDIDDIIKKVKKD